MFYEFEPIHSRWKGRIFRMRVPLKSPVQDRQVMVRRSLMRKSNKYFSTILWMLWFQCIYRIMISFVLFYQNRKLEKKCTFMIMQILFYQNSCSVDGILHWKIKLNIIVLKMVESPRFVIRHRFIVLELNSASRTTLNHLRWWIKSSVSMAQWDIRIIEESRSLEIH